MKKRVYSLLCIALLCIFSSPLLGQNIADSILIKDEWNRDRNSRKVTESEFYKSGNDLKKIKYSNRGAEYKKVEIEILGNNRYNRTRKHNYRGRFSGHWSGVYFGLTNYLKDGAIYGADDQFMRLNWSGSRTLIINPFQTSISFTRRNNFGMVLGVGFEYQRLLFSDDHTTIAKGENGNIMPHSINKDYSVRRNVLKHLYFTVPVIFEWNSKQLFISGGIIGGARLHSKTKVVFDYEGDKSRHKNSDDFSMIMFKVDATVKIGYRDFAIFSNYTLTDMFENNKGIKVYPLTIGIGYSW